MHSEVTTMSDKADATVLLGGSTTETTGLTGYYDVKCLDSAGNVKWEETITNLVTTVGKNDILDNIIDKIDEHTAISVHSCSSRI